jgi:hypothetical protein
VVFLLEGGEIYMTMIYDLDNEYGGIIIGDGGEDVAALKVSGGVANKPAVLVARQTVGNVTVAPLRVAGTSAASAAQIGFRSAISLTSVILTSVAHIDYAVAVEVNGEPRYIPLLKKDALVGAAVHS